MATCPITHAKAYPFDLPSASYVLHRKGWQRLDHIPAVNGRTMVIASGSNASPQRLSDKFADHPDLLNDTIPVIRAKLHDFDTVYSAHVCSYGAIPATLAHVPGAIANVFVTWLTDAQLARLNETEAVGVNYDLAKLSDIHLLCEEEAGYTSAYAYLSRRGCLNRSGQPVPLAAIRTEGRQGLAMSEEEVLDFVRTKIAPHEALDDFIRQQIECPQTRAQRSEALATDALPHGWSSITIR